MTDSTQSSQQLIDALQAAAVKQHGVDAVQMLQTHISWILLIGESAYKFKKPVDLGFVDFTTLEKRHTCCREEIRLNGRLAPSLYLGVESVTGSVEAPRIGGEGTAIEYAVHMKRFPQDALLSHLLERGELRPAHINAFAREVAEFHRGLEPAPSASRFGNPEQVHKPVSDSFSHVADSVADAEVLEHVRRLREWSDLEFADRQADFARRKQGGAIRECHGDMHLGNIVLLDGQVTIFDCIEFNEDLRWIDVMSEVAFAAMDLEDRGRSDLGHRFLNAYLQRTGDYDGLAVFHFYAAYRAMVRAKVAALRGLQDGVDEAERGRLLEELKGYLHLAEKYSHPGRPWLLITHGVSGSGKTHGTQTLVDELGAIRIRSDVERKRLFGLEPDEHSDPKLSADMYSAEATRRTYDRLREQAGTILDAGFPAIVDATFLRREHRDAFRGLAQDRSVPFRILDFRAAEETLKTRVARRKQAGSDASEADLAVLAGQLERQEPLSHDELPAVLVVDTEQELAGKRLQAEVEQL